MVTVGIDPHKHVHVAVAVGDDGRPVGKPLTAKNDALLIITLLKWVRSITDGTATWAIEDGRGFRAGLLTACCSPARRWSGCRRGWRQPTAGCMKPPAPSPTRSTRPPSPGRRSPRPAWTGTGSMSASASCACWSNYRADLVKRRTMAINQLKAQVHLWLDQTPGDLTRARNVNALATLISAAQLSPHVRQALADMTAEIAALSLDVR